MITLDTTQSLPLAVAEDGTIRIKNSRITLDSIVYHFKMGSTPEEIAHKFPTLGLVDIYSAVTYFLSHRDKIEAYLLEQDVANEESRRFVETNQDTAAFRERLLARAVEKGLR